MGNGLTAPLQATWTYTDAEVTKDSDDGSVLEGDNMADLSGSYSLNTSTRVYAKVDNVLDDQEIVSRSPHGARPNLPRTAYVGISVDF